MTDAEYEHWEQQLSISGEIIAERDLQDARFGVQNHVDAIACSANVMQVVRECAQANCEADVALGTVNWVNILDEEIAEAFEQAALGDQARLREELVQVAAVAVAWIECIDRRKK